MQWGQNMIETIISTIASFVGTNIDDIFINTLFFAEADTREKERSVILGIYFGIGALVVVSMLGAAGLQFLPQRYIGYLGLIPIGLGIREWLAWQKQKGADEEEEPDRRAVGLVINVMLVTMANGADNVGVYLPLFAGFAGWQMAVTAAVFAVMIGLWCVLGKKLSDLPFLRGILMKYKQVIVPVVYIALGAYILLKNL